MQPTNQNELHMILKTLSSNSHTLLIEFSYLQYIIKVSMGNHFFGNRINTALFRMGLLLVIS